MILFVKERKKRNEAKSETESGKDIRRKMRAQINSAESDQNDENSGKDGDGPLSFREKRNMLDQKVSDGGIHHCRIHGVAARKTV